MRHRFYTISEDAMTAMRDAISRAKVSVYWENYIFSNDIVPTHDFFALLARKAREGIRVVIILDSFGSSTITDQEIKTLRDADVELLFFSHWFRRIHRKILIVDEQIGFFGGVNIGKQYVKWLDLHLRVTGKLVRSLIRTFAKSYALCGGTNQTLLEKQRITDPVLRTRVWLLEHWPVLGAFNLRRHYEERIRSARERIVIVTPYFIPHVWFTKALKSAEKRGVSIDIILPAKTDPKIGDVANYLNAHRLSSPLIRFFFTSEMIHAKALLIDDREGMVGSQNIDALSFDHNMEVSAVFEKKTMLRDLARIITTWKSHATPFERTAWKPRWYHTPLTYILDLLQPVL